MKVKQNKNSFHFFSIFRIYFSLYYLSDRRFWSFILIWILRQVKKRIFFKCTIKGQKLYWSIEYLEGEGTSDGGQETPPGSEGNDSWTKDWRGLHVSVKVRLQNLIPLHQLCQKKRIDYFQFVPWKMRLRDDICCVRH